MILDVAKPPPKRTRGRPRKDRPTKSVSGRVAIAVSQAMESIADINRRSVSTEIGMAAEELVLRYEKQLREMGAWTAELDQLKKEHRPVPKNG